MSDELIDICDSNNNLTGEKKMKSVAHKEWLWHRTVHIWIYNSNGEILLQRRAKWKDLYPDMLDVSAAWHVSEWEEPIFSWLREIEEEIGLIVSKEELKFQKVIERNSRYWEYIDNEFSYVYFLKYDWDILTLCLQEEEVESIKFVSLDYLENELKKNSGSYVPHWQYWFDVIKEIKSIYH